MILTCVWFSPNMITAFAISLGARIPLALAELLHKFSRPPMEMAIYNGRHVRFPLNPGARFIALKAERSDTLVVKCYTPTRSHASSGPKKSPDRWRLPAKKLLRKQVPRSRSHPCTRPGRGPNHVKLLHRRAIAGPPKKRTKEKILIEVMATGSTITANEVWIFMLDIDRRYNRNLCNATS